MQRVSIFFLLLLITVIITSCSQQEMATDEPFNVLSLDEPKWVPFRWDGSQVSPEVYWERAGLYVPISIEGYDKDLWLQLDTGIRDSRLFEKSLESINAEYKVRREKSRKVVSFDGSVLGYPATNNLFTYRENYGWPVEQNDNISYQKIGSLGLDFLKGRVLALDFDNSVLCVVENAADLPGVNQKKIRFVEIQRDSHYLTINVTLGTEEVTMCYDSGTAVPLWFFNQESWRKYTKRRGDEEDNKLFSGRSWGKPITLMGAEIPMDLLIGNLCIKNPEAYFMTSHPDFSGVPDFTDYLTRMGKAIIGNGLFSDQIIIIDLVDYRLGIAAADAKDRN